MSPLSENRDLIVLGFFPPPFHGQAIWTSQFAESMRNDWHVHRVNLSPSPKDGLVRWKVNLSLERVRHYLSLRRAVRDRLKVWPTATVIWPALSPMPLGHFRDLVSIIPGFCSSQSVFGVVHWGNFQRLFESSLTRPTASRVIRRMEGLVFLDESLADRCSEWVPREKRFVVPNTVGDDILVSNDEARTKIEKRAARADFRVLFVSNMIRSKGYLDVLDALRILNDRSIDFAATFAGSWESSEDEDRFWYLVKSGGLKGRVRHLGAVTDRKEIRQMFVEADVFVLPTYYSTEAQPLSILEAMNAATPVVVTRHAAIPHMVAEGKEGIFVEARNADSVADALESLVERTTWQELAHGAKRRFEQDFHPSVVRSRWNQLLSSEANRRG